MGQKVNPIAIRLNYNRKFDSSCFSDYYYKKLLYQDINLRDYLCSVQGFRPAKCIIHHYVKKTTIHLFFCSDRRSTKNRLAPVDVSSVIPHRVLLSSQNYQKHIYNSYIMQYFLHDFLNLLSSKTSSLALEGRKNLNLSKMQSLLSSNTCTLTSLYPIQMNSLYQSACLIAQDIAVKLEQKKTFRQICRFLFSQIQKCQYIKGIRVSCSGRINGAEIAKTECKKYGETSLHMFSNFIDYAQAKAFTPYGILGIQVWVSYVQKAEKSNYALSKTYKIS